MHVEWGAAGLREVLRVTEIAVVVDVLTFSTAVALASERGVRVHPHRAADAYAAKVAIRLGAHLAGPERPSERGTGPERPSERETGPELQSLASLAGLGEDDRVVLPSATGGALCLEAASRGVTVVVASLRNATAVGDWLLRQQRRVVLIATGDRWHDGSFRMTVEDLLGAGAVLARLPRSMLSAEAKVAVDAFRASQADLPAVLRDCISGRELTTTGFGDDVGWAAESDVSSVVPVLDQGSFRPARDA
ncbi:MAG: 2-phosphosulfolactate phosphatase [Actinobacteria bacterium]|nr:2-phosphosulfolactate phosphatase [Actinomycetota bacterium]